MSSNGDIKRHAGATIFATSGAAADARLRAGQPAIGGVPALEDETQSLVKAKNGNDASSNLTP